MIEDIIEVDGQRWRIRAKSMKDALLEIALARVMGSVGSISIDDNTLVGGTEELRAEVHRIDAEPERDEFDHQAARFDHARDQRKHAS